MHALRSIRHSTLASALGWLVLVFQATIGTATAGQVLCIASDGHVVVELAHAGDCGQEVVRHHGGHAADTAFANECGAHPCADILIASPASRASAFDQAGAALAPASAVSPAPRLLRHSSEHSTPDANGMLSARRCVVLRV